MWDLYLYNDLFLTDLPYSKRAENLLVKSIDDQETSLKGIEIIDYNPLFEDEDVDGIPDEFAAERGGLARDAILERTGATLLVEYLAREKW